MEDIRLAAAGELLVGRRAETRDEPARAPMRIPGETARVERNHLMPGGERAKAWVGAPKTEKIR